MLIIDEALVATGAEAKQLTQTETISYQVIHSCKGRFRIRISRLAYDSKYANKLKYLVDSLKFVTSVRLNPAASSMVVQYNDKVNRLELAALQEQVFTAIKEATRADIPPLPNSQRSPLSTDVSSSNTLDSANVSSSSTLDPAKNNSAILAEPKSLHAPSTGKTPKEYGLLVRGNYSIFA